MNVRFAARREARDGSNATVNVNKGSRSRNRRVAGEDAERRVINGAT
jgi:hypothetical protein